MSEQPAAPAIIEAITPQVINEGATFGPFDLKKFIASPDVIGGPIRFKAELVSGSPLPKGLICMTDGTINGIPAPGTYGTYEVVITAENDSKIPFVTQFELIIKSRPSLDTPADFGNYKSKVWEALMKNLPLPELTDAVNRPITAMELYYLLQRFGVLTIWDVYNLEMPQEKTLLTLEGASKHYNIYDRGSCIVGAPKDLYSHDRTSEDALMTSRAMAREVYKRNWTVELAGFNKMIRGAWVELQHLGDKHGRHLDVLHFTPTVEDMRIYSEEARAIVAAGLGR